MGPVFSEDLTPAGTAGRASRCDLDIEPWVQGVHGPQVAVSETQNLSPGEAETFRTGPG